MRFGVDAECLNVCLHKNQKVGFRCQTNIFEQYRFINIFNGSPIKPIQLTIETD